MVVMAATELPSYLGWLLPLVVIGIVASVFWNGVLTLVLWRLTKADRINEALDRHVHELTDKLVDERLRAMTHEVNGHVQGLVSVVDEMKDRLKDGDSALESLVSSDHKIELAVAAKFDALKDWIRENTASKSDVNNHQASMTKQTDKIGAKVEELGQKVAVLTNRMGM
jgi:hypothetical protein